MYRKYFQLLIVAAFNSFVSNGQSFEWVSSASFDTISSVGTYHQLIQTCTPDQDSMIVNGRAFFSDAHMKNIGQCIYTRYFEDTICLKATIEVKSKKQYGKLLAYFKKYCDEEYQEIGFSGGIIYSCTFESLKGKWLNATFVSTKRKKSSILIIE